MDEQATEELFLKSAKTKIVKMLSRAQIRPAGVIREEEVAVRKDNSIFFIEFFGYLAIQMRQRRLPVRVQNRVLKDALIALQSALPTPRPLLG